MSDRRPTPTISIRVVGNVADVDAAIERAMQATRNIALAAGITGEEFQRAADSFRLLSNQTPLPLPPMSDEEQINLTLRRIQAREARRQEQAQMTNQTKPEKKRLPGTEEMVIPPALTPPAKRSLTRPAWVSNEQRQDEAAWYLRFVNAPLIDLYALPREDRRDNKAAMPYAIETLEIPATDFAPIGQGDVIVDYKVNRWFIQANFEGACWYCHRRHIKRGDVITAWGTGWAGHECFVEHATYSSPSAFEYCLELTEWGRELVNGFNDAIIQQTMRSALSSFSRIERELQGRGLLRGTSLVFPKEVGSVVPAELGVVALMIISSIDDKVRYSLPMSEQRRIANNWASPMQAATGLPEKLLAEIFFKAWQSEIVKEEQRRAGEKVTVQRLTSNDEKRAIFVPNKPRRKVTKGLHADLDGILSAYAADEDVWLTINLEEAEHDARDWLIANRKHTIEDKGNEVTIAVSRPVYDTFINGGYLRQVQAQMQAERGVSGIAYEETPQADNHHIGGDLCTEGTCQSCDNIRRQGQRLHDSQASRRAYNIIELADDQD